MSGGSKFYVYGGGRWREVDVNTGSVAGWGPAKFVCARQGRLVAARRVRVLKALRDLQAGVPSAIRDGPQLSQKRYLPKKHKEKRTSNCFHCHCCQHGQNNNICSAIKPLPPTPNKKNVQTTETAIQTSQTLNIPQESPKQTHIITTKAIIHSPHKNTNIKSPIRTRLPSTSSKSDRSKRLRSSPDIFIEKTPKFPKLSLKKNSPKESARSLRAKKRARSPEVSQSILRQGLDRYSKSKRRRTVSTDSEAPQTHTIFKNILKERRSKRNSICHELIIGENEVKLLRNYLINSGERFDLKRFDKDDKYKAKFFYRINPLVNVERCPKIAEILAGKTITIEDFASQLGLRSVSEVSEPRPRYLTRNKKQSLPVNTESDSAENRPVIVQSSDSEDKENFVINRKTQVKDSKRAALKDAKVKSGENRAVSVEKEREIELEIVRDSEEEIFREARLDANDSSKLYTSTEDACIARWLLRGGRARLASGNRVWRALAARYRALAGRARSWHSLRTRYLRYILPRLHSLPLQPSQQRDLRAAHSQGEIKSRRAESRRNSIFGAPTQGASSRRPGPPPSPPPVTPTTPSKQRNDNNKQNKASPKSERNRPHRAARNPTPRYSELTRQFAANHRPASSSSENEANHSVLRRSGRLEKPSENQPRTRRLFNPKIML